MGVPLLIQEVFIVLILRPKILLVIILKQLVDILKQLGDCELARWLEFLLKEQSVLFCFLKDVIFGFAGLNSCFVNCLNDIIPPVIFFSQLTYLSLHKLQVFL